jgi:DNA-binding transcriptional LysR family regulator
MNLQHLEVFVSVGKHLSLTRAAKDLRVGQPSVTKQLRALEESVKAKLYLRKGRGIALTEKGKDLYLRANPILSQVEVLRQIFEGRAAVSNVGLLTVGGGFAPSSLLLPSVAVRLQKRHPELEIYLRAARTHELEQVILDGKVEFAVATSPAQSPELFSVPYRPEQLVFFARPDDPLTRRKNLKLADLASIRTGNERPQRRNGRRSANFEKNRSEGDQPNFCDALRHGRRRKDVRQKRARFGLLVHGSRATRD